MHTISVKSEWSITGTVVTEATYDLPTPESPIRTTWPYHEYVRGCVSRRTYLEEVVVVAGFSHGEL